jgi:Ca2+-binding RTX toxin-like protein
MFVRPFVEELSARLAPASVELGGFGVVTYTAGADETNHLTISLVFNMVRNRVELTFEDTNQITITCMAPFEGGNFPGVAVIWPNPNVSYVIVEHGNQNDSLTVTGQIDIEANGGDGDDVLAGWSGNDTIQGGAGSDDISGNGGNDQLSGGPGIDFLYGNDGTDTLNGGSDDDSLVGGANDDTLEGGLGSDLLDGEAGNDFLKGGGASGDSGAVDRLWGRSGVDTFVWAWEDVFEDYSFWEDVIQY